MECYLILFWILCGLIGGVITQARGRGFLIGLFLGLLLGPFGLIIAALFLPAQAKLDAPARAEDPMKKCPKCAEMVQPDALICRFCRHEFDA